MNIYRLSTGYLALVLCYLSFSAPALQAADLMDIFRSARDHDPNWEAQQLQHEAEKQAVIASEALLYPQVTAGVNFQSIDQSGTGQVIINPDYLDQQLLVNCIISTKRDGDACDPPLTIRDDAGGHYDTYTATVQMVQPLYNYELWRGYNKAKHANEQFSSRFEKSKQDLIINIAEAYFLVLKAHEEWELSKTETENAETQLEQTKKRFQLGIAPQNDVYDVRSARDSSQVKLLLAKTALENAQENLMLMTQRRDVSLARLSEDMVIEPPQPQNVEEWVKKGLQNNRTLLAAHSASLAAKQELASKRGGYHPVVNLIAGYSKAKNDIVAVESAPSVTKQGVGVTVRYDIYKGGLTSSEVKTASLNYDRSLKLFEFARRDTIRKIRNDYRQVINDVKGVEAAKQAIHSSEKSLEAAQAGYRNGTRPLITVLKSQTDLFRSRKEYANARYNYILDSLRLKYDAGTLAVEDLHIVNSWLEKDKLILPPEIQSQEEVEVDLFY